MICFEIDIILIIGFMSAGLSHLVWFRLVYRDSVTGVVEEVHTLHTLIGLVFEFVLCSR